MFEDYGPEHNYVYNYYSNNALLTLRATVQENILWKVDQVSIPVHPRKCQKGSTTQTTHSTLKHEICKSKSSKSEADNKSLIN